MFKAAAKCRLFPALLLCVAFCAAAIAAASPAAAQYRRSCWFVVEVDPTSAEFEDVSYAFRIFNTVYAYREVNDARRAIVERVRNCLETHWNDRNETRPHACQDYASIEMSQYPFDNMYERIRQDICNANRGELRLSVNIRTITSGKRGCWVRSHWTNRDASLDPASIYSLESDFQFNCPIREGSLFENVEAPVRGTRRLPGLDFLAPGHMGHPQSRLRP